MLTTANLIGNSVNSPTTERPLQFTYLFGKCSRTGSPQTFFFLKNLGLIIPQIDEP